MSITMWQTTGLDEAVAIDVFGFQWWAFDGRPINSHPEYRNGKEMRVRQLMSPKQLANERWQAYLKEQNGALAAGDEPLAYTYCSIDCCAETPPHVDGHADAISEMEKALVKRKLFDSYLDYLAKVLNVNPETKTGRRKIHLSSNKDRCMAALLAVGSKYVTLTQETAE